MTDTRCVVCVHELQAHQSETDGKVGACRVTRCPCQDYAEPAAEPMPATPRRVCIDVPDGYVLSISLIPQEVSGA
ncbi:MAG: hypothetical protein IT341_10585 [Chloroflexi bacterium]|nr:hypothetical protein [Chloroflexota bacterium]